MWACDPALTTTVVDSFQVAGPLFVQGLQTFLAAQCALAGDHLWPDDATDTVIQDPNYDFIVVGAGSAGAVVANRLSEVEKWKVLLIEAGGNPTLINETPQVFYNNIGTAGDWKYKPEPNRGYCRGYKNNQCSWPRGKTLGGCSSINAMFYVRANKVDYNEWAADGNAGWSYEEVLPYFKKSENFADGFTEELGKYHGINGYLNVENDTEFHVFEKILIQAANELGVKTNNDVNGYSQMGIAKTQTTTKNGVRHSTARAFLSPIKDRKNLHVMKNAYVTKILFKPNSNIVTGVVVNKNGKDITVNAHKEVIVSAGAINTPQLLLLSGIGPSKHLKELKIDVKADLSVGKNLQDHVVSILFYSMPGDTSLTSKETIAKEFASYIVTNKGPLSTTSPHRIISFINTTDASAESPDVQFHYLGFPPGVHNLIDVWGLHGMNDNIQAQFRKLNEQNTVLVIYAVLLHPKSKGKVLLRSKNPNEHPIIDANYYDDPDDLTVLIKGIQQHVLKLKDTKTFKSVGLKQEWLDIDECKDYKKESEEFLECYSRVMTLSLYHPTSTCKMGPTGDRSAVVDNELRVHNVERLRVIDASIMPNVVRGNTNAPSIMIGEKGADLIKKAWMDKHSEL